jgi:hypothetical protein
LTRVSEEDKYSALYIKSTFMVLSEVVDLYADQNPFTKPSNILLNKLNEILNQISKFIFGFEHDNMINFQDLKSEPLVQRQRFLKDLGFIDFLMDIVYLPFKNHFYKIDQIQKDRYFTQILRSCYSTLKLGIQEYRPNEIYASQWLKHIISHSIETHHDNDINAGQAMRELIDNNRKILETRITKEIIEKFVNEIGESKRDWRYTEILRAICICNNQAMIQNQKFLSELILENKINRETILVPIKITIEKEIKVWIKEKNKWENMLFLKSSNKSHEEKGDFYRYFISLTKLLADLCFNRNYVAIDFLNKYYSLELCVKIFTNFSYHYDIREAFCTLTRNLWINVSPYYEVKHPSQIKLWEEFSDGIIFSSYNGNISGFKKLKDFIPHYLESYIHKEVIKEKNELSLFKSMLETLL